MTASKKRIFYKKDENSRFKGLKPPFIPTNKFHFTPPKKSLSVREVGSGGMRK